MSAREIATIATTSRKERPSREFLCCLAAGRRWYIDLAPVRGVQHTEHMQINPTIDGPLGWILEDDTPVFSLAKLVGGELSSLRSSPIILIETTTRTWGLVVERLLPVQHVDPATIHAMPRLLDGRAARFCQGVVVDDDTLHLYLSSELLDPENPTQPKREPLVVAPPGALGLGAGVGGRLLMFQNGRSGEYFGLSLSQVVQILSPTEIFPVPGLKPPYLGLLSWRSRPLPVLDLNGFFGLGAGDGKLQDGVTGSSRFLVVRGSSPDHLLALVADRSLQVWTLPFEHRLSDVFPPRRSELMLGSFEFDRGNLWIPSLDGILELVAEKGGDR